MESGRQAGLATAFVGLLFALPLAVLVPGFDHALKLSGSRTFNLMTPHPD